VIGVVIPVRDQAAYLGEALDSIAAQRVPAARIVVVDDGSTDGSADVARHRGIAVLETAGGQGAGAARDLGARHLDTPLLAFLDADDRFTPYHHAVLGAALGAGADVACGLVRQFADPARAEELRVRHRIDERPVLGRLPSALMIRRTRFEQLGGFGDDLRRNEVFDLFARLNEVGCAIVDVPTVVVERRVHGDNMTIVRRDEVQARYLASARAAILRRRESA
jgi:glycosyltransferase involved in cell wall biosynthesis